MFFASTPFVGEGGSRLVGPGATHDSLRPPHQTGLPVADYYSSFHQHRHSLNQLPAAFSMAAYQSHQDELAQFQELSNKYEPEATVWTASAALSCLFVLIGYRDPL